MEKYTIWNQIANSLVHAFTWCMHQGIFGSILGSRVHWNLHDWLAHCSDHVQKVLQDPFERFKARSLPLTKRLRILPCPCFCHVKRCQLSSLPSLYLSLSLTVRCNEQESVYAFCDEPVSVVVLHTILAVAESGMTEDHMRRTAQVERKFSFLSASFFLCIAWHIFPNTLQKVLHSSLFF